MATATTMAVKNMRQQAPPVPAAPDDIPVELRSIDRWITWGFVDKGKAKPAKVPFAPGTTRGCDYTEPQHWRTFDAAYAEAVSRGLGLGFVLTTDDDITGIDLDNAFDENQQLRPWAAEILDRMPTWAETTPSGLGLHLLGRSDLIAGKTTRSVAADPQQAIERYSNDRYLTFTGKVYRQQPVADIRDGMAWLEQKWFPESQKARRAVRSCENRAADPELDLELARVCLQHLGPHRASNADDWRRVGYALKATGEGLLEHWLAFSRQWPGFDEDECRDRWARFAPVTAGLQTLVGMAADDSGKSFGDIRKVAQKNLGRSPLPPAAARAVDSAAGAVTGEKLHGGSADLSRPHTLTEVGLARRLAGMIRGRLVYVRERKEWLAFDGMRWAEKAEHVAVQYAKRLHDELWRELGELSANERTSEIVGFVQGSGRKNAVAAVVNLAQSEDGINHSIEEFDQHPYLLNLRNGVLDLQSGELRRHDPRLFITQLAAVDFDPHAHSELWDQFVRDVTCDNDNLTEFLQQAFGLALTADVSDEVLICHSGGGSNGKSTALEAVAAMLGDYATTAPPSLFTERRSESHPTEIATLHAKRFAIAIETEANKALRESLVKSLTGGDTITTRRMREDFWRMTPTWHLHIAYNRAPRLTGTDDGIRRRLLVMPYNASFKDSPDLSMKERLVGEAERSGILNWCLEGLRRRLAAGRLFTPEEVMIATADYIEDEDILGRFLDERTEAAAGQVIELRHLLQQFRFWMERDGAPKHVVQSFTTRTLARELNRRGHRTARPDGGPHRKQTIVLGMKLTEGDTADDADHWVSFR